MLARLAAGNRDRESGFHIPRRGERRAPLTFAQQGIWFRQQLAPESPVWNLSRTWDVSGPARPDGTRTRAVRDRPPSRVTAHPLPRRQRRAGPGSHAGDDRRGRCARARSRLRRLDWQLAPAFDLTSPVMVRAGVAILGPEQYELTLTRHHICSDQWSSGIFRRELSTVYDDLVAGREPSLPDLRLQFNDYAWWASDTAKSESTAAALAEAVEALKGMPDESALARLTRPPRARVRSRWTRDERAFPRPSYARSARWRIRTTPRCSWH